MTAYIPTFCVDYIEIPGSTLANFLMHADHFNPMRSCIHVYTNRIEFVNGSAIPIDPVKSNVELHLEKDALLLGADKSKAYDSFPEDICAIQPEGSSKVLVYAYDSQNIAITGEGVTADQKMTARALSPLLQ